MTPNENKAFGLGMIAGVFCVVFSALLVFWASAGGISCNYSPPSERTEP